MRTRASFVVPMNGAHIHSSLPYISGRGFVTLGQVTLSFFGMSYLHTVYINKNDMNQSWSVMLESQKGHKTFLEVVTDSSTQHHNRGSATPLGYGANQGISWCVILIQEGQWQVCVTLAEDQQKTLKERLERRSQKADFVPAAPTLPEH